MTAQLVAWTRRGLIGAFLERSRQTEILDRSYQIAAQLFVALIPLILIISVLITGGPQYLARTLIERFELVGFAAQSVQDLFKSENGQIYWLGVLLSIYAAFSLSKRVSRAYTILWQVAPLPLRAQWRGLVWVVLQLAMIGAASSLRRLLWHEGALASAITVVLALALWVAVEFLSQFLLTNGQVTRRRLLMAAVLVAAGKLGTSIWALWYLSTSMSRQAELYGPLGVVFSLFTYLLVISATMLVATLMVAVATDPTPAPVSATAEEALDPGAR